MNIDSNQATMTRPRARARVLAVSRYAVLMLLGGAFVLGLAGCAARHLQPPLHRYEFTHPAMGTLFSLTVFATNAPHADAGAKAAFARIDALEDKLSDYQADSELSRLKEAPVGKPVPVSADLFDVLSKAQEISRLSNGAFDVTVGPYVRLWRFSRKRKVLPTAVELAEARRAVGFYNLELNAKNKTVTMKVPGMRLDVGGIAKGYAADQALGLLKSMGMSRALVAASGDIAVGDPPPGLNGWKIGIEGTANPGRNNGIHVILQNAGISTSGGTEQFVEIEGVRYAHILSPLTSLGLTNFIQATVIAPNATSTDALATTVCVLGVERGMALIESLPRTATLVLTSDAGHRHTLASRRFEKFATMK